MSKRISSLSGHGRSDSDLTREKRLRYATVTWPEPFNSSRPQGEDTWEAYGIRRRNGGRVEQTRSQHRTVPQYIESLYPPRATKCSRLGDNTLEKYLNQTSPDTWRDGIPPRLSSQAPLAKLLELRSDARQPANASKKRRITDRYLPRVQKPLPPLPFSVFRPPPPTRSRDGLRSRSLIVPTVHAQDISFPKTERRRQSTPVL